MNPGRELDALIARAVFKQETFVDVRLGNDWHVTNDTGETMIVPHYSTDIAAAWQVLEVLKAKRSLWSDDFSLMYDLEEKKWRAGALQWRGYEQAHWWEPAFAMAETAPHAICLAGLKAVGAIS